LTLDPQRHTAARDGRPLELSVKEFGVLEALMRAAPTVLRTEDLLEQVWDENADPFTNAVFNTLSRLRRKLGDPPIIETQPGVGYRITQSSENAVTSTRPGDTNAGGNAERKPAGREKPDIRY
jgi:DNA-binding response OmpR family regulator